MPNDLGHLLLVIHCDQLRGGITKKPFLDGEQAWTSILNLKSFVMDSVQVGKAVFGKEIHTTLGIEPRTILQSGEVRQPF